MRDDRITRTLLPALICVAVAGTLVPHGEALAAKPKPKLERQARAQLVKVRKAARRIPKRLAGREARERDREQATRALRAARKRRWCAVASAVPQIDHVGKLRRPLRKVERLLKRLAPRKRCRLRPRKARTTPVQTSIPSGRRQPKPTPTENDQGENEKEEFQPPTVGPFRPRPGGRGKQTGESDASAGSAAAADPFPHAASPGEPIALVRGATEIGGAFQRDFPLDPSVAAASNVVVATGNDYIAISKDAGGTFTALDPVADVFGANDPDGGFCCDQVVHYDPDTNLFFWLSQYWCTVQTDCATRPGENRYRLAFASPDSVDRFNGRRWNFVDLTSDAVGLDGHWMDYPDLSIGSRHVWITFNAPSRQAAVWARIPKANIENAFLNGGGIDFQHRLFTDRYGLKPVQSWNYPDGAVIDKLNESQFALLRWAAPPDDKISTYVVDHPTTPSENCAEAGPDGFNFLEHFGCGGFSSDVGGAAMDGNNHIWVAWTSGRRIANAGEDSFPHAHIELTEIGPLREPRTLSQDAIWNSNFAYGYPYLSGSPSGEVAMSYMTGGPSRHASWGAAMISGRRSLRRIADGAHGQGRFGDYLGVRAYGNNLFVASGFVVGDNGAAFEQPWVAIFGRSDEIPKGGPAFREPTTLNVACPALVAPGGVANVNGRLSPPLPNQSVVMRYTGPNGAVSVSTTQTDQFGNFTAQNVPDQSGSWHVRATFEGSGTHSSSSATCAYPASTGGGGTPHGLTLDCPPPSFISSNTQRFAGTLTPPVGAGQTIQLRFSLNGQANSTELVPLGPFGNYEYTSPVFRFAVGSWTVTAHYPGDATNQAADSLTCSFTTVPHPP